MPFTPNYVPVFSELRKVNDLNKQGVVPIEVLDRRLVKKGNRAVTQVLVRWSNIPPESATWEDLRWFVTSFLNLSLGDKQHLREGEMLQLKNKQYVYV